MTQNFTARLTNFFFLTDFVKKTDFVEKLKNIDKNVTSNKTKHVKSKK